MPFEKGVSGNPTTQFTPDKPVKRRGRRPLKAWRHHVSYLFEDLYEKEGLCPFIALKEIAFNPVEKTKDRLKALAEICNYLAPKIQAIKQEGGENKALQLNISLNGEPINANVSEIEPLVNSEDSPEGDA